MNNRRKTLLAILILVGTSPAWSIEPIFSIAASGSVDALEAAIAAGADVNATTAESVSYTTGVTVLMHAALRSDDPQILQALLDAGADLAATDSEGYTALMHAAAESAEPEIVRVLVDAGAQLERTSNRGETALMLAAASNTDSTIVRLLITLGADAASSSREAGDALARALSSNLNFVVALDLIQIGMDLNRQIPEYRYGTPFGAAVAANIRTVDEIATLIGLGADPEAPNSNGERPIYYALDRRDTLIAQYLVGIGVDIDSPNRVGWTPLMAAADSFRIAEECVTLLLDNGADPTPRDILGRTVVDAARLNGRIQDGPVMDRLEKLLAESEE